MNLQTIKTMLGENYNIAQRPNGQISVGIANSRLKDTPDAVKVRELIEAHTKLQAKYPSIPDFDSCFKAGNPPLGPDDKDRNNKPIWRQYLHLLFELNQPAAPVADAGVEYLRMLLATGMDPVKAAEMVLVLTKGAKPTAAIPTTTEEILDGDSEVPV